MKNRLLKMLLFGALMVSQTLFAVPAQKGVLTITQPDGTTIDVYLSGDERIHWYHTTDNYTLMANKEGFLEYAILNEIGDMIPSGRVAHNPQERSITEMIMLNSIAKNLDYSPAQKEMMKEIANKLFGSYEHEKSIGVYGNTIGVRKSLIILVAYTDVSFTYTREQFDDLFNQVGYNVGGATGSVRDYFLASSFGKLEMNSTVVGPYTLPHNRAFYGADVTDNNGGRLGDINARQMIIDACMAADSDVDFAQFDGNGDGLVDGVHVIYADRGQADGGGSNTIWPHRGELTTPQEFDGVRVQEYSCSAEKRSTGIAGIGTIAHELGHVLGLPDYYDVNYGGTRTPYNFDIMDNGCYNNNQNTPPLYCAYSRMVLSWVDPYVFEADMNMDITALPVTDSNAVFVINSPVENNYFIFENRERDNLWDEKIYDGGNYDGGLLVMQVNKTFDWGHNNVNVNPDRPGLRIVRADGVESGTLTTNSSGTSFFPSNTWTDVYPGTTNATDFSANDGANPSASTYSIQDAVAHVWDIVRQTNGTITFKVGQGVAYANETTTLPATNISYTSATLNGQVTENSQNGSQVVIEKGFVYGVTPFPTINTSAKVIATSNNMALDLSNLAQGQTYYFRAYSTNAEGTTYGGQEHFLTLSPAITNNFITDSNLAACITGEVPIISASLPEGGSGNYTYKWIQSNDNITYTVTPNAGNTKDYTPISMTSPLYFKRIVLSADKTDTSSAKYIPVVNETTAGTVSVQNDTVQIGSPVVLSLNGQDGNVMFWQRKFNNASWITLSGSVNTANLNDLPDATGDYQYRTRVQNGACPGKITDPISIYVTDSVGLYDLNNNETAFEIFPNPANDEIMLSFKETNSVDMWIVDVLGRPIFKQAVKNGQKIDLKLSEGTFFVILQTENRIIGKKKLTVTNRKNK
ncbi:MAG: M6 family metalloprotease domain-containing protein [Bacteroidales bacterium]|jgi:M6 family metalloprotease-like protein|nr:M6 family metalloprotease domain-containing protein [Bacteroidales bacterium]